MRQRTLTNEAQEKTVFVCQWSDGEAYEENTYLVGVYTTEALANIAWEEYDAKQRVTIWTPVRIITPALLDGIPFQSEY